MKFIFLFLFCYLSISLLFSQSDSIQLINRNNPVLSFDGIPITGSIDKFHIKLKNKGYKLIDKDSVSLINTFSGSFLNQQCTLYVVYTPKSKQVCKVSVYFLEYSSWNYLRNNYEELKRKLSNKYGIPTDCNEYFIDPYQEGDGNEELAIESKKCVYECIYRNKEIWAIYVGISRFMQVNLAYENTQNMRLLETEQDEIDNDRL